MAERTEVAARVLDNYATALRGDWSSIDGRSERHSLNMLSAYLRGERESISERDLGVCMMTDHPHWMRTHWTGEGWGHECEWF